LAPGEPFGEAAAVHVLHRENTADPRPRGLEDLHDVRVLQAATAAASVRKRSRCRGSACGPAAII